MSQAARVCSADESSALAWAQGHLQPLFVVGGLYSTANGVAWIMKDLAAALGRLGAPVTVCAAECVGRVSVGEIFAQPSRWRSAPGRWVGGLSIAPALKPILEHEVKRSDVVHNHSVWMLPTSYASRIADRLNKPVVFTAHGTLEPWALANSRFKKRVAGWLFQNRDLRRAACIHVNSVAEAAGVRAYGLEQPIAVLPNGVDASFLVVSRERAPFERSFPEIRGRRVLLFMGRLHKKKGLQLLVPAWARLARDFPDWVLVIAGPDRGFEVDLRRLLRDLELGDSVVLTGNLDGDEKLSALKAAELFVLPSFSEGFSMAVLEAMAAAVPVLLTPGCNFPEAAELNAAVMVDPTVKGVESGLRRMLSLSDAHKDAIGRAARKLITDRYTWDRVAGRMTQLYSWLARGTPRPEFVLSS